MDCRKTKFEKTKDKTLNICFCYRRKCQLNLEVPAMFFQEKEIIYYIVYMTF